MAEEMITVQNVGQPGKTYRVGAAKYHAMHKAMMAVLPDAAPGMAVSAVIETVRPTLPGDLFPGGEGAGWWVKCVQLDLEAKGVIARADKPPVRLYRAG